VFFWIDAAFLKQSLGDVLTYIQENH